MSAPIDWEEDLPSEEPARKPWAEAFGSTSVRLRQAEAEVERLRAELKQAHDAGLQAVNQRDRARDMCDRLGKDLAAAIVAHAVVNLENGRLRNELAELQEAAERGIERLTFARAALAQAHKERDEALAHTEPAPEEQP